MDSHELKAFLAVAETGSFSRAAEQLRLTQPAVSKRVQGLESRLGARLFDRAGKRIYLTDAGELLLPRARDILHRLSDTRTLLQNLHGRIEGHLRLATSHHAGLHRLAPVLGDYARRYPQVKLDIRFVDSEVGHALVRDAEVDLAVVTLDPAGGHGLEHVPLWHDPLEFVATAAHPLGSGRPVMLSDLTRHQAILPGLGTFTGRIVAACFAAEQLELGATLSTNYLETIGMMVKVGLGWSVLPRSMLERPMVRLPVQAPALSRDLGCVRHPGRTLSNPAQAFLDTVTAFADTPN